jgi:hypothetical protein
MQPMLLSDYEIWQFIPPQPTLRETMPGIFAFLKAPVSD